MWVTWDDDDYYYDAPKPTSCAPARPAKAIALEHQRKRIEKEAWDEMYRKYLLDAD